MVDFMRFHDLVNQARRLRAHQVTDQKIRILLAKEGATKEEIDRVFETMDSKLSPAGCVVMPVALIAGVTTAIVLGFTLANVNTVISDFRLWIVAGSAIAVTVGIIGISELVLKQMGKSIFADAPKTDASSDAKKDHPPRDR